MAMVISQSVVVHDACRIQTDLPQDMFAVDALVAKVMERETDPRMAQAEMLINFIKKDGNKRGLPIVAMNNVRMLVRFEDEFQRRTAKESESFNVVIVPVKNPPIEKIVVRMRVDKKAFEALHEPEVNVAVNPLAVVRHPKIAVGFGQVPDAIVPHVVVFREDDLNRIAANVKFSGKVLNDVTELADFCGGSAFGGNH